MLEAIIRQSKRLPRVTNFFSGKKLPEGFRVPSDILLFCHDIDHPRTIISSRYMLIIPFTELTYEIEGQRFRLPCGQAVLVKPFLHRSVPALHQNYLRLIVSFEVEGEQPYLPQAPVMTMTKAAWAQVRQLLGHYRDDDIMQAAFSLATLLTELSQNTLTAKLHEVSAEVNHATALINQYLGETFGLKDIAGKVGWSVSHLRRMFRQETGLSIGDYISRRRISAAQRLLSDTPMKVEDIARSCGYDTIYSFSRFFKRNVGVSPLKFRQQQKTP